jgi:hypothetical protein
MQRSVDGSGNSVLTKGGKRIIADHLVFVLLSAIQFLQLLETIQVEQGKPGFGDRANVPSTTFYRKNTNRLARERIWQFDLRTCVATAEVRNAEICSEQI